MKKKRKQSKERKFRLRGKQVMPPNCLQPEMLEWLDQLREEYYGTNKMLAIAPMISNRYELDEIQAMAVLRYWFKTYCPRHGITTTEYDKYYQKVS